MTSTATLGTLVGSCHPKIYGYGKRVQFDHNSDDRTIVRVEKAQHFRPLCPSRTPTSRSRLTPSSGFIGGFRTNHFSPRSADDRTQQNCARSAKIQRMMTQI